MRTGTADSGKKTRQLVRHAIDLHRAWIKKHETDDDRYQLDLDELLPPEIKDVLGPEFRDAFHSLGCCLTEEEDGNVLVLIRRRVL